MTGEYRTRTWWGAVILCPLLLLCSAAQGATPEELLRELDDYPHVRRVDMSSETVIDHEIGLGAMQKIQGAWRFKSSKRYSGTLLRYTWQIVDGFTSKEVMDDLVAKLEARDDTRLIFSCAGRACGPGAQWANRVFGQRILYGVEDRQRYRVYELHPGADYRLVLYSSARTADRQYFHADLLRLAD